MAVNEEVPAASVGSDEDALHRMGYAQELRRRMSGFSNFAVSFTIISILSGCLTLYGFGMNTGGPVVIVWGWPFVGLMTLFALSLIPAFYPGANIQLTFVLALVIVLPTSMVFAMLSVAMPRSGGDYVYVSRALGPAWGMMSNWNQTVWWILYGGVPSAFFAYYGLTPLLRSLGVLTNNPGLITWGDRLSTPTGAFLCGTALIVILVVIFATGMNFYFRIQNVLFVVAMLGVLLTIAVLLPKNPASFQAGFNHSLASTAGTSDPYQAVMTAAKKDGFATAPFSLYWTIIPITWIYLELVFNQSSAYIGGEVRRPGRVQIWSMPAAAVISMANLTITVPLIS